MKARYSALLSQAFIAVLASCLSAAYAQSPTPEFKGAPDKAMAAAHESFVKGDTKKAGEEVDRAANYVKRQSHNVDEASKADMDKAAAQLDKLGDGIKNGTVKSGDELKATFAKTDHQMAICWNKSAQAAQKMGKDSTADLAKAGTALDGAAKWSGNQLDEGTQKTVDALKKAGKKTSDGATAAAADVEKWSKNLERGIEDLGHKLF